MKYLIIGGSGFIGKNLIKKLLSDEKNVVTSFSRNNNFKIDEFLNIKNLILINGVFNSTLTNFSELLLDQDVIIHLISTTSPATSNYSIKNEILDNVFPTIDLLDACVKNNIKKVIFVSSGGTIYGKGCTNPINEDSPTNPISSYGTQKLIIEKYLLLYKHLFGLDCSIVRLANPYGPYQLPNKGVGLIVSFLSRIIEGKTVKVFGDGNTVRDYIYIDDVTEALIKISKYKKDESIFNIGTGKGKSINEIIAVIEKTIDRKIEVEYIKGRISDVDYNVLDVSRYEKIFGFHQKVGLEEGIKLIYDVMKNEF